MKGFAEMFTRLDQTTRTSAKVEALAHYFAEAPEDDRLWTIALLSGRRPKRVLNATILREWAANHAQIPPWLFEECYPIVGDLAETIALVLPPNSRRSDLSLSHWIGEIRRLTSLEEAARKALILDAWDKLDATERFLFNKLLTGGFRVGVSRKLMTRALAQATGIDEADLAHRLLGDWTPDSTTYQRLILAPDPEDGLSRPYPFYLAYQLEEAPDAPGSDLPGSDASGTNQPQTNALGPVTDWLAEWKWDGIRGQLVRRGGLHHVWSRGEELMTDRFPDLSPARDFIPDGTVLDGEILAWAGDAPLPFAALQKRIGRKTVPKKLLAETPVILLAYDLLEWQGQDLRDRPLAERRTLLSDLTGNLPEGAPIRLSPPVEAEDWRGLAAQRARSRDIGAEGLMLKRLDSPYLVGRKKGDWWKWKVDPLSIDAVMIYAQAGHGRRANLFTDFTFAVWDGDALVPFTKAYSGLTDAEFRRITQWVRKNTLERFGPVRSVKPEHVFEIHFEGIQKSPRHKSGVALRFPRMSRWREDKPPAEANTLQDLRDLLAAFG